MRGTQLGPFYLEALLGQGGMGQVWSATHPGQNVQVAIKIMHADFARHGGFKGAFYDEVRAVSGLDHPNVVGVLDYGEVEQGQPPFVPGCPWLAMELVAGRNLFDLCGKLPWPEVRTVLRSLLDGLAHAHARGVIHRDIKPGNVLLGPTVVLCDFGLAHAVDWECSDGDHIVGTPPYMAPEQFRGLWRDYGPWTDLYSLGCLAWSLVTGTPPFGYSDLDRCRTDHLETPPGALSPSIRIPEGVEDWLRILLAKRPEDRFQRAADAAWALEQLKDSRRTEGPPEVSAMPAPMLDRWRRAERASPLLRGAGLGLWGLRSIPMVDRDAEREVLWRELRKVRVRGQARSVVLRGPTGCGKTRLADWLAERAEETGAATTLRAIHSAKGGPSDGLGAMLARHLRCVGLDGDQTLARAGKLLSRLALDADADAVAELVLPEGRVTFGGPGERHRVLERVLSKLARERPLVLVLDDVQWGADALAFAAFMARKPVPVLLVLTAQDEALAERPDSEDALAALDGRLLTLGMLPPAHQRALVRERLGLADALATEVESRTGGNPLFAIQLVGDWIQRGVLHATDEGFLLASDAPLPDGVHQVWTERVERLLATRPRTDREALELAACLGQDVRDVEWNGVCHLRSLPDHGLEELLVRLGLARRTVEGWTFAHGMLRESIERRAREEGRWGDHALTCAKALSRDGDSPARLGGLLLEAGRPQLAVAPLLEGALRALTGNEFRDARELLETREGALVAARIPESDPAWGEGWLLQLRMARVLVDRSAVNHWADRLIAAAKRYSWQDLHAMALVEMAAAARKLGSIDDAFEALTEVERVCALKPNAEALGRAAHIRGVMLTQMGELSRARAQLRRALALLTDDPIYQVQCLHLLALVARYEDRNDEANRLGLQALRAAEAKGIRYLIPMCKLGLGEDARLAGDPVEAERWYREAAAGFEDIGSTDHVTAKMNVGLALMEQQRWADAQPLLETARAVFEEQGRATYLAAAHVSLLPCSAHAADWEAYDRHLDASKDLLEDTGFTDYDMPRFCELAAARAEHANERHRAMRGWALAAREWQRLGREDDAERALQRAASLTSPAE